jgi:serine/threonine-protein kinase
VFDHHMKQNSALKILTDVTPHEIWKEAELLSLLSGKFLLPVRNADLISGVPYIVTEIARHGTTEDSIKGVGVASVTAVRWVIQACRGIARMHDSGLVHNDIKPGNLFLDAHGDALLGDLGYASQLGPSGFAPLTGGTPATMPPETATAILSGNRTEPCSVASDVYGLGATLYWLLAGRPPHVGPTPHDVLTQVLAGTPPRLQTTAPHVPQGVRMVVEKAMSRNAADRFQTASELDYALARLSQTGRLWTRITPHPGHSDCFEGHKGSSVLAVCAAQTGVQTQHEISVRHQKSGRMASAPVRAPLSALPQRLRTIFRLHS